MNTVRLTVIGMSVLGLISGCVTSQFQPVTQAPSTNESADSVTIFLLERELPSRYDRLGVVTFRTYRTGMGVHTQVQQQLKREARQRGANGAFRLREGTYDRQGIVAYLLFHYTN